MHLIQHARALMRLVAILGTAIVLSVVLLLAGIVLSPWPRQSSAVRGRLIDVAAFLIGRTAGMRVTVEGQVPSKPFVLVANHLGYMDIVLIRLTTGARFVSKAEIASWPLFGRLARLTGTLFIDRGNKRDLSRINNLMGTVWDAGDGLAVFPEGTSSAGSSVLRFHAGLLSHAAESGTPVHAAALHYAVPNGPDPAHTVCWWGDMTFLDHLYQLLRLPHFHASITFADHPVTARDRRTLAAALETTVRALFRPIEGAPPA